MWINSGTIAINDTLLLKYVIVLCWNNIILFKMIMLIILLNGNLILKRLINKSNKSG